MTGSMTSQEFIKFEPKPRRSKFGNLKVEIDGIKFDSKKEANYYSKLVLLQKSGEVLKFELQPKFEININGIKCGFYKADFKVIWKSGSVKIIDVKGMKTPVYSLKKRIIEALYGIKIIEV